MDPAPSPFVNFGLAHEKFLTPEVTLPLQFQHIQYKSVSTTRSPRVATKLIGAAGVDLPTPGRLSTLERGLCLFSAVQPGEGLTALVMFANVFLVLCAYYLVKPLRDGWMAASDIAGLSSMEVKAYTSFAQSLALIGAVALHARLVTRWPRRELITRTTVFCISNLLVFWLLRHAHVAGAGVVFYIWVGMFGLFVVAQFWNFAADLYTEECGHRLMPMIAIGATAGAVAGSFLTEAIVRSGILDSSTLLLVAILPLIASVVLTAVADTRGPAGNPSHPREQRPAVVTAPTASRHVSALALVFRHRYLVAVAGVALLTNWVSTNGENLLFRVVQEALQNELAGRSGMDAKAMTVFLREGTTAFYGSFFFWVNVCALFLQAFLASRMLKLGGIGLILLMLPVIALVGYSAMTLLPFLLVVRVMKTAENSTSYSINNTARQVLWLPTTTEMKYKAKPAVETLFVRLGDGLAAVTVLFGMRFLGLSTRSFLLFNVFLGVLWLLMTLVVVRDYRNISELSDALVTR
jgi:ATP:ADP antiporter, AAA family